MEAVKDESACEGSGLKGMRGKRVVVKDAEDQVREGLQQREQEEVLEFEIVTE